MLMFMMGPAEIMLVYIFLLAGTNTLPDAAEFVPPRDYFQFREIKTSIESLMDLATREPKEPRTSLQQLLALRQLGQEAEEFKKTVKAAEYRRILQQIAAGTRAQDPQGFAKEYAQRTLDQLDGKQLTGLPALPLKQGLDFLPAHVNFLYALTFGGGGQGPSINASIEKMLQLFPAQVKTEMYNALEQIGNVRIERICIGMKMQEAKAKAVAERKEGEKEKENNGPVPPPRRDQEIYVRVTGKVNPAWFVAFLKEKANEKFEVETKQGPRGESMTFLRAAVQKGNEARAHDEPVMVLIGDQDFLVVGYDQASVADNMKLMEKALAVRARQQPDVTQGGLKERLQKVPAKAVVLVVGDVPEEFNRTLPLGDIKIRKVDAYLQKIDAGLDFHGIGTMGNTEQAIKAVQKISEGRKEAIAALKKQQDQPAIPGLPVAAIINVLETVQVQTQEDEVQLRLLVPTELIRSLPALGMGLFGR
jgi:hypothetical protein